MAVLSPDGVWRDVFELWDRLAADEGHPGAVDEAIDLAARHSLLSWSELGDALIMHRLTARVLRERAKADGTLVDMVANSLTLLEGLLLDESKKWVKRDHGTHLASQFEALWHTVAAHRYGSDIANRALALRVWAIQELTDVADLTRAIDIGESAFHDCESVLGGDHSLTCVCRERLAAAYQSAGRLAEVNALNQRNLNNSEWIPGRDHPTP